jgi:hypothetical protein
MNFEKIIQIKSQDSFLKGAGVFFILGILSTALLFPKGKPKSEVCRVEIDALAKLTKQNQELRLDFSAKKTKLLLDCKTEAREDTFKKIEDYKKVCEALRCEICNQRKR